MFSTTLLNEGEAQVGVVDDQANFVEVDIFTSEVNNVTLGYTLQNGWYVAIAVFSGLGSGTIAIHG